MSDTKQSVIYSVGELDSIAYEAGEGDYTVAVLGQNHGDEKGPVEVFQDFFQELPEEYDDLSLSFIPEANVFASSETERKTSLKFQPNRADQRDLNRSYDTARKTRMSGGSISSLKLTHQAAYHILGYLEELDPDLVIDMHTGTSGTVKMPQVRYKHRESYPVDEQDMEEVAGNAGVDILAGEPDEGAEMLGAVAPKMGFPAVTLEVGGGVEHGWENAFGTAEAERYEKILRNIFEYALENIETARSREFSGIEKYHLPMDVEGEIEYNFELGEDISEGDVVATVDGHDVVAEHSGAQETVLVESLHDEVSGGNRVFNIATEG